MSLKDLYERKRDAYAVCRGLLDQAAKEDGRSLTAEENAKYETAEQAMDAADADIRTAEQAIRRDQKLAAAAEGMQASPPIQLPKPAAGGDAAKRGDRKGAAI